MQPARFACGATFGGAWLLVLTIVFSFDSALGGSCKENKLCCPGRDSACVVQNTPLNSVLEDLNEKPCYCDHACLKLGDCCTDFKDACGVTDCQVGSWEAWSDCDTECGPGTMVRARKVKQEAKNGGKHCPSLTQKRGCLGTNCPHNPRSALKETAMLLPIELSSSKKINETSMDIRENLWEHYTKNQNEDLSKEYCVVFQVIKISRACKKESHFSSLREGGKVCVRCESQAMRPALGYRCPGHGTMDRSTRWSALSIPHCHGRWMRLQVESVLRPELVDNFVSGSGGTNTCPICEEGPAFIFV
uniref:Somatomedin-B and thrombospondin type-1 domain-containing protein n=3 Tax=Cacopsylla melanoneura TaxID=428564 RepID=A0A8D8SFX0_9HEMI